MLIQLQVLTSQSQISKIQALAVPADLQNEWCYSANDVGMYAHDTSITSLSYITGMTGMTASKTAV